MYVKLGCRKTSLLRTCAVPQRPHCKRYRQAGECRSDHRALICMWVMDFHTLVYNIPDLAMSCFWPQIYCKYNKSERVVLDLYFYPHYSFTQSIHHPHLYLRSCSASPFSIISFVRSFTHSAGLLFLLAPRPSLCRLRLLGAALKIIATVEAPWLQSKS